MRFVVVGVGADILVELLVAARVLQDLEKCLIGVIARRIGTGGDHRGAQADGILHTDRDGSAFIDISFQVNAAVGNKQQYEQQDPEGHDGIKTETFVFHKAFSFGGPHSWAVRDLQRVRFHYSAGMRRMSTVLQMLLRRKSACGAGGEHKIVACDAEEHQGAHGLAAGHKAAEHQQKGCFNGNLLGNGFSDSGS